MIFAYKHYEKMVGTKFPVLDEIRQLETESDFPVTLSIGIGVGGESLLQTDQFRDRRFWTSRWEGAVIRQLLKARGRLNIMAEKPRL